MARARNPAHRASLLDAATRVFAAEGLGASTASIAKAAGVSAGTLFIYFESKAALINALYVVLKSEMGRAAAEDIQVGASRRDQLRSMWDQWMAWGMDAPDKRRALAHLSVAEELSDDSRHAVHAAYAGIAAILEPIIADGPMCDVPLSFVSTLMSAIADATIDDLIANPDPSGTRNGQGFDAMWRALAG